MQKKSNNNFDKIETLNAIRQKKYSYLVAANLSYICSMIYNIFCHDGYTFPANIEVLLAYFVTNYLIHNGYYIKEKNDINLLYNQYTDNIAKLNKELNIDDDIIKINELFYFLYRHGYLSVDKKFTIYNPDDINHRKLGIEVASGQGVCRNLCGLFQDTVYKNNHDIELIILDKLNYDLDYISNNLLLISESIINATNFDDISKILENQYLSFIRFANKGAIEKIFGNHVVIGSNISDKYILMDPINNTYWFKLSSDDERFRQILDSNKKNKGYKSDEIDLNGPDMILSSLSEDEYSLLKGTSCSKPNYDKITKFKKNDDIKTKIDRLICDRDEIIKKRVKMKILIDNNMDIIEKFYNDNSDLYKELSKKISLARGLRE